MLTHSPTPKYNGPECRSELSLELSLSQEQADQRETLLRRHIWAMEKATGNTCHHVCVRGEVGSSNHPDRPQAKVQGQNQGIRMKGLKGMPLGRIALLTMQLEWGLWPESITVGLWHLSPIRVTIGCSSFPQTSAQNAGFANWHVILCVAWAIKSFGHQRC